MTKITVRKKHIQQGVPCNQAKCPVSLAIAAQTGLEVKIGWTYTFIRDKNDQVFYIANSDKMKKFIDDFDLGKQVRPFTFNLVLPTD